MKLWGKIRASYESIVNNYVTHGPRPLINPSNNKFIKSYNNFSVHCNIVDNKLILSVCPSSNSIPVHCI